eukprot:6102737-Heterocapsa_arctica.AAC.1
MRRPRSHAPETPPSPPRVATPPGTVPERLSDPRRDTTSRCWISVCCSTMAPSRGCPCSSPSATPA